jgi:hypothetical protein
MSSELNLRLGNQTLGIFALKRHLSIIVCQKGL